MSMYELSSMDKKILNFLVLNGAHFSDAQIAKKLRLSPTTVNYKIRKLREEKVIANYIYRINPYKMGYTFSAFCFIELSSGVPNMKGIIDKLLSYPSVFSLYVLGGNTDILVKLYLTEKDYLGSFITWIGENLKKEVKRVSSGVITREFKVHNHFLDYAEKSKLNKKEKELLNYKVNNPNSKLSEAAKELGIHRNTVSSYWKRFWNEKILLKKEVVISKSYLKDLNLDFEAVIFTECNTGETEKLVEKIKNFDEISELCSISSKADLITFLKTGGVEQTYKSVKAVYSTNNIINSNTHIVFSSHNKPFVV